MTSIIVVMILWVYAMWNQSKKILYLLLLVWIAQTVVSFIFTGIYSNPDIYLLGMYVSGRMACITATYLISSHSCPIGQFLFLRHFINQHHTPAQYTFRNPAIYSWHYTLGSRCHPNLEAVV